MLSDANVQTMLPVKDLKSAEKFYGETLGLKKTDEEPGGAVTFQRGPGTLTV
jgi:catechol 2,3-dioxygenase-like lactoylglutathione lyase family enzyme